MKRLPLYPQLPQALVAQIDATELNPSCTRCDLHEGVRTPCLRPEGEPGGVLLIGDHPGKMEDQLGRPFVGVSGKNLRDIVRRHWAGPIAYDSAIRCAPGARKVSDKHIDHCRSYLTQVIQDVRPQRIVLLGGAAMEGFFGLRPGMPSVRQGFGFYFNELDDAIPVFFTVNPVMAARNRFWAKALDRDLAFALTATVQEVDFAALGTYLVEDEHDAAVAFRKLKAAGAITYDVETHGRVGNSDFRLESVTLAPDYGDDGYTWTRRALRDPATVAWLVKLLQLSTAGKITQNGKYDDLSVLATTGASVGPVLYDTRLGRKLLEPEAHAKLEILAFLVGMGGHKEEAHSRLNEIKKELRRLANPPSPLTPKGNVRKIRPPAFDVPGRTLTQIAMGEEADAFAFGYLDDETLYRYNARDVFSTRAVAAKDMPVVQARAKLVWEEITAKANVAVRHMERWGMGCDRDAVKNFSAYCTSILDETRARLDTAVSKDFNPDSPAQVGDLLFKKLKLRSYKKTASGADSTDAAVLESLEDKSPIVRDILRWRKYRKLNSNYAEGMLIHIREDGRVHPSFLLDGTGTGRASCQDPNLQNIPRAKGDPDAKLARSCFVAAPGWSLLEFDYGQIELRVAAYLANDRAMIADFQAGIDIHLNNATELCEAAFGIPRKVWDKMSKDERDPYRSRIKTATFGKLYQKSIAAMAREFGIEFHEMEKLDARIWGKYKRLARWCKEQIVEARRTGEVWTYWNGQKALRRPLWAIGDNDERIRKHAENASVNTPVQGTAAHYTMASLMPIVDFILEEELPAKLCATVHDSVILEVRDDALVYVAGGVKSIMTGHNLGDVPLVVDAKTGPNWGSMADYHVP